MEITNKTFLQAVEDRRSYYAISKESPISQQEIMKIIEHGVNFAPSAFNSQSARVVVLFGKEHDELWNITKDVLKKIVPEDKFSQTEEKINSFQSGYGTILFFEEQAVVEKMQTDFPTYKDNFPLWSLQSSGMLQFVIWTALEEAGFGASLQHYNPLIDERVKARWSIPESYKLWSQMPFGKPVAMPDEKNFEPLENRIKVFG